MERMARTMVWCCIHKYGKFTDFTTERGFGRGGKIADKNKE